MNSKNIKAVEANIEADISKSISLYKKGTVTSLFEEYDNMRKHHFLVFHPFLSENELNFFAKEYPNIRRFYSQSNISLEQEFLKIWDYDLNEDSFLSIIIREHNIPIEITKDSFIISNIDIYKNQLSEFLLCEIFHTTKLSFMESPQEHYDIVSKGLMINNQNILFDANCCNCVDSQSFKLVKKASVKKSKIIGKDKKLVVINVLPCKKMFKPVSYENIIFIPSILRGDGNINKLILGQLVKQLNNSEINIEDIDLKQKIILLIDGKYIKGNITGIDSSINGIIGMRLTTNKDFYLSKPDFLRMLHEHNVIMVNK